MVSKHFHKDKRNMQLHGIINFLFYQHNIHIKLQSYKLDLL